MEKPYQELTTEEIRKAMDIMDSDVKRESLSDAKEFIRNTVLSYGTVGRSKGILSTIFDTLCENTINEYDRQVAKGETPDAMAIAKEELRKLDYKVE
jgi:predicted Zn-dependent peptidase